MNQISRDSTNMAVLIWVGTLICAFFSIFMFVPSLIFYFVKQDDPFIFENAKEALNFSITILLAGFVSFVLMFVLIGFFLLAVVFVFTIVVCIMGIISASKGDTFRAPMCIRLIK